MSRVISFASVSKKNFLEKKSLKRILKSKNLLINSKGGKN